MKKKKNKYILLKNCNAVIFLLLLFFGSGTLCSQEIPVVNVTFKLKVLDGDLKNSQITITKTEAPYLVISPNKEGDGIDLPLGFEYTITFTKMGYNTKRVLADTHVPENREKKDFERLLCEVTLEKLSGKLEDNYVQLIGKIAYSIRKADFDFEKGPATKENIMKKNDKAILTTNQKSISPSSQQNVPVPSAIDKSSSFFNKATGKNKVVQVISEDYKTFTIITITIDGKEIVFKKEEYGFGVFYYKDGKRITENTFLSETL